MCALNYLTDSSVNFMLNGQAHPNNSIFFINDIGEGDLALSCVTHQVECCKESQAGEWFYPNNTLVLPSFAGLNFYQDRNSQAVHLNRRNGAALSPTGKYHCRIPDAIASGTFQILVANIIVTGKCLSVNTILRPHISQSFLTTCVTTGCLISLSN